MQAAPGPQVTQAVRYDRGGRARRPSSSTPYLAGPAARRALFRSRRHHALLALYGEIDERHVALDPRKTDQLGRVAVGPKRMPRAALAAERFELLGRHGVG